MNAPWSEILGAQLRTKSGVKPTDEALAGKKIVGIYFSASWCPPCRQFTPVLTSMYDAMVQAHPDFELVLVPSDRTAEAYEEYYAKMGFCSVPFEDEERRAMLGQAMQVETIPKLVFFDGNVNIIGSNGRDVVAALEGDAEKVWEVLTNQPTDSEEQQ